MVATTSRPMTQDQLMEALDAAICPLTWFPGFMDDLDAALASPDPLAAIALCGLGQTDYTAADISAWNEWREEADEFAYGHLDGHMGEYR